MVMSVRETQSGAKRSGSEPKTTRLRLLVIDDEPLLGQTIRLGLEDAVEVTLETSGDAGLQKLLQQEFDLILCDLSLPDTSGIEIYRQLSSVRPELKERFVVMTGGASSTEAGDFLESYEGPLLTKPFTLREVERLIRELVPPAA